MTARKKNPKTGKKVSAFPYDHHRKTTGRKMRATGLSHLKPRKFKDYLTMGEAAALIPVDPRWLRRLEAEDRIPRAQRVPMGTLEMRLWSPEQVEEIRTIIEGHKVGRPKTS
jgi:hypothetical protein